MRSPETQAWPGVVVVIWLALAALALGALAAAAEAACPTGRAALQAMLSSEYAFAEKAQTPVPGAFLEFLADDSLVLNPAPPQPGRAIYRAAKPTANTLEWYPTVGDIASSADLVFTSGPWVYTAAPSGKQYHGHILTVWTRDAECRWRVEFDGGTSHAAPLSVEPKLHPAEAPFTATDPPPRTALSHEAARGRSADSAVRSEVRELETARAAGQSAAADASITERRRTFG